MSSWPATRETLEPTGATYGASTAIQPASSADGRLLAIGTGGSRDEDDDPLVRVFELETGVLVAELDDLVALADGNGLVSSVGFSPDGSRLVVGTDNGAAVVWDTSTWEPVEPLLSRGGAAVRVKFSPDGRWLVSVALDGTITLRDPETFQPDGRPLLVGTDGAEGFSLGPVFTADGRYMITLADGQGRLWDLDAREQIGGTFPSDEGQAAQRDAGWNPSRDVRRRQRARLEPRRGRVARARVQGRRSEHDPRRVDAVRPDRRAVPTHLSPVAGGLTGRWRGRMTTEGASMSESRDNNEPVSRARFLRRLGWGAAAVAGGAAAGAGTAMAATADGGVKSDRLVVDVACLGHTNRVLAAEAVSADSPAANSNLVEGWIYPLGTVPGDGFVPTEDGSIGRWFCWGWNIQDPERPEPHLTSVHNFVMGAIREERLFPPDTLVTTGLQGTFEDEQVAIRAVSGGTGAYLGATGQVLQRNNGRNTTIFAGTEFQALNWVFEFDLRMPT